MKPHGCQWKFHVILRCSEKIVAGFLDVSFWNKLWDVSVNELGFALCPVANASIVFLGVFYIDLKCSCVSIQAIAPFSYLPICPIFLCPCQPVHPFLVPHVPFAFFIPLSIVPNYRVTHRRLFVITFRENKGNLASGSCIHLNSEPKYSQRFLTMIHYRDQASILEELSVHEFQFDSLWISNEVNEVQQSLANQM